MYFQGEEPGISREIAAAIGRQAGPIRLRVGDEKAGLVHIEMRHGEQARTLGYADVREMVEDIARNFDAIYSGNGRALILAKRTPVRGQLYVQLEPSEDGDFYDVKTATPSRKRQFAGKKPIWERAAQSTSSAEAGTVHRSVQIGEDSLPQKAVLSQAGRAATDASPRGTYAPDADVITLFRSANPSTVIHEMGHRWLFEMVGDLGDSRLTEAARRRITADLQALMDHMGVKIDVARATPEQIRAALSRDHHETFARMTEAYFFEGSAPSRALERMMARLSAWLIGVYRKLRGLNVTMTPQVRAVFDRLLATDDAIAEARDRTGVRLPAALKAVLPPQQAQSENTKIEKTRRVAASNAGSTGLRQGPANRPLIRPYHRRVWCQPYRHRLLPRSTDILETAVIGQAIQKKPRRKPWLFQVFPDFSGTLRKEGWLGC
ncbi:hypothetical protein [Novispirillum itersonii]|uniref:hypothetical protein n=1 Tax=Novispirillum itersonii TaxID=189 RepID=UPI0016103371|nr:hypothetical protein [Novispirillum itersonii]